MNLKFKLISRLWGLILMILGIAMIPALMCSIYEHNGIYIRTFAGLAVVNILIGSFLHNRFRTSVFSMQQRDGIFSVLSAWIIASLVAALPYMLSGFLPHFSNAFFESMAGLTTTGATITKSMIPRPLLLWKATTHWLGGMGILIFILAFLPSFGSDAMRIMNAEAPGADLQRTSSRTADLSKKLYIIYSAMTLVNFLLLWAGSPWGAFESLINAMGSVSTSGTPSFQDAQSLPPTAHTEFVMGIFMLLSSTNFFAIIHVIKREFGLAAKFLDVKIYYLMIAISTLILTCLLLAYGNYDSIKEALHHSLLQVVAFASTSGCNVDDYMTWPICAQTILFVLMFIGGCSASTSGSLKVYRVTLMAKMVSRGNYLRIHPQAVRQIRFGDQTISQKMVNRVMAFAMVFFATYLVGVLVISMQGCDLETSLSTSIAMLSTTGCAFGEIGASGYFGMFNNGIQIFLALLMMIGRLEIFTVLYMFLPSFWNPNKGAH